MVFKGPAPARRHCDMPRPIVHIWSADVRSTLRAPLARFWAGSEALVEGGKTAETEQRPRTGRSLGHFALVPSGSCPPYALPWAVASSTCGMQRVSISAVFAGRRVLVVDPAVLRRGNRIYRLRRGPVANPFSTGPALPWRKV